VCVCACVCVCVCVGTYQFVVFFLCGISDTNLKCAEATDQALQADGESLKMNIVDKKTNPPISRSVSQRVIYRMHE
jgi:hypothetical protein